MAWQSIEAEVGVKGGSEDFRTGARVVCGGALAAKALAR